MTRTAGWYPDENDAHVTRYWNGTAWSNEKVWDGTAWVDQTVAATAPVSPATLATRVPTSIQLGDREVHLPRSPAWWVLCGGAAAITLGSFLPWAELSGPFGTAGSQSPPSAVPLLFIALAVGVLAIGWPATRGAVGKGRAIGMAACTALLSIFMVTNWAGLSKLEHSLPGAYRAGPGIFLYSAGVVALWVGIAVASFARRRPNATATQVA